MGHSLASYWRQLYGDKMGKFLSLILIVYPGKEERIEIVFLIFQDKMAFLPKLSRLLKCW